MSQSRQCCDCRRSHRRFYSAPARQNPAGKIASGLEQLVQQGRARLINRYVSVTEEKNCFAASDVVLLPYLNHFRNQRRAFARDGGVAGRLLFRMNNCLED